MFRFEPLTPAYKKEIGRWVYAEDFKCYDMEEKMLSVDELIDDEDYHFFVGLNEGDEIVGFAECNFLDNIMEIAHGLHPELLGKGLSYDFICSSIDFLVDYFEYTDDVIRIHIELENKIAMKAYRRVGFVQIAEDDHICTLELELN